MSFGDAVSILAAMTTIITCAGILGWVLVTWIKSRERIRGGSTDGESVRQVAMLTSENERLHLLARKMEERLSILETIATDPAQRTAREIEDLRRAG